MLNIGNEIKDAYQKITVSEELQKKILNKTINHEAKRKVGGKIMAVLGSIIGLCTISLSVVYADDIREYLDKWYLEYSFTNHEDVTNKEETYPYKEVSNNLYNTYGKGETFNYEQVEKFLGFKVLKSKYQTSKEIIYTTYLNNDNKTIASVNLWLPDFIKNDQWQVSLDASFFTPLADIEYKMGTVGDATGASKKYVGEETTKLGSKVLLYTVSRLQEGSSLDDREYKTIATLNAQFVYDGIKYTLSSYKQISTTEILEIINSLTF